jgi:hypothetical protein
VLKWGEEGTYIFLLLVLLTEIVRGVSEVLIFEIQKLGIGQDPKPVHMTAKATSLRFIMLLLYHILLCFPNSHF